jgi:hypothetical protein
MSLAVTLMGVTTTARSSEQTAKRRLLLLQMGSSAGLSPAVWLASSSGRCPTLDLH